MKTAPLLQSSFQPRKQKDLKNTVKMAVEFVHLHVHSDYSILDGACSVKGIAENVREHGMHSVALTDHGNMGGAVGFYQQMCRNQIKPLVGCELYISPTTRFDKDPNKENIRGFHILLLAADFTGYTNLCKLVSRANLEGMYYNPRIDREILASHSGGLIGLSACLKGEIASACLAGRLKKAKSILGEYLDIFGRDNFYLEIMDHGMKEQKSIIRDFRILSREFEIPIVATNDVHYLKKEHFHSHEAMLCIQTRSTLKDTDRFKFSSDQLYFKSPEEMAELFSEMPETLKHTLEVAEKCNLKLPLNEDHYPVFRVEGVEDLKGYLRGICTKGIIERYSFNPNSEELTEEQTEILQRMDYELDVIARENYVSYFLIVWDFIKYAKENDIAVGPGRGSGAGSIVAYLTRITDVDPIRYGLLFERFLNPERVSPPDFDIDLCERNRNRVIDYVRKKYGEKNVAQIGTYGTLKAKAAIKDIARVLGFDYAESEEITKLVPDGPNVTLEKALKTSRELSEKLSSERYADILKLARPLEGLNRNRTIHAAGVIIGDQPITNLVPLAKGAKDEVITQYPQAHCEALGLLKMDFLGLRNLTVIQDTETTVKRTRGVDLDFSKIPLDDEMTYELINRGDTIAVFQLESSGMRDLCRRFGVSRIEHIIALIALYRPGPMRFIDEFLDRKTGKTQVVYDHPAMEKNTKETFGIMLYQEQVMQVVQDVAGFSLGQADILRRAISKKKEKEIAAQLKIFREGCEKNGINAATAEKIWEKIQLFAGYGFNKSHSAAYGFLAYYTAYLKANYPVEFMSAVLSSEIDNADKVALLIRECGEMGIAVLPPDINRSFSNFTVDGDSIRFGLAAIKGVGTKAATEVIEAHEKGDFKDMLDFCKRTAQVLNSRMLDSLIRAGALDGLGVRRSQLAAVQEDAISCSQREAREEASGQGNLFELLGESDRKQLTSLEFPDIPEFEEHELLEDEKRLLGFYVTGHPLGRHAELIERYSTHTLLEVPQLSQDTGIRIGGLLGKVNVKQSKSGRNFAVFQFEDLHSNIECLMFSKKFEECGDMLLENNVFFIEALVDAQREERKLLVEEIVPIEEAPAKYTDELHIRINEGTADKKLLEEVRNICSRHTGGDTRTIFCIRCTSGEIAFVECSSKYKVKISPELVRGIREISGEESIHYKVGKDVPKPKPRKWPRQPAQQS